MEEKRVPVVGDTWRCRIGDESSDWLLLSHADEEWQVARVDGPQAGAKGILLDAYFFAGPWGDANEFVRSAAPPKELEAPKGLHSYAAKDNWTCLGCGCSRRDGFYSGSFGACGSKSHDTCLCNDFGFAPPASPPVVEAPRVAQPKRSEYQVNTGRALMLEEGPGIALMLANPCRLVACGHRACTPKSTEPWHSNFDDADLMGRDV